MNILLKLLALSLFVAFQASAEYQLLHKEEYAFPDNTPAQLKLNQLALNYLRQEAKEVIHQHKTGSIRLNMSAVNESGHTEPAKGDLIQVRFTNKKPHPLNMNLAFDDINIQELSVKSITFEDNEYLEKVRISDMTLIGKQRQEVSMFFNSQELAIVFNHGGYNYKLIHSDTLKVKKRKRLN